MQRFAYASVLDLRLPEPARLVSRQASGHADPAPSVPYPDGRAVGSPGWPSIVALIAAYLCFGLIGHDPWKADEGWTFGLIHSLLDGGDWLVPQLAGEAFMEKPPLFLWTAAIVAKVFSPWLAAHDAVRLASAFFTTLSSVAIGLAARVGLGAGQARFAVLAFLSCIGLLMSAHLALVDDSLVTGFALANLGLAIAPARPRRGGLLLGLGTVVGFLSKGVLAPAVVGVAALGLPVAFRNWRTRAHCLTLGVAALVALPLGSIWPIALYERSAGLFEQWFWINNVGRFTGTSIPVLGARQESGLWLETLPWFTFPALPLAAVTLWRLRRDAWASPLIQACGALLATMLVVLILSASGRALYALPLLPPLALMAAPGAVSLAPGVDKMLDLSARVIFGVAATALWVGWTLMMTRHGLPDWFGLGRVLPLDYQPQFGPFAVFAAAALTVYCELFWMRLAWRPDRTQGRALISWFVGLTLCWSLSSTLWLPWIDARKSYRAPFTALRAALPLHYRCIRSTQLGESERALLDYFAHLITLRSEKNLGLGCDLWLIQARQALAPVSPEPAEWELLWRGGRHRAGPERFELYRRRDAGAPEQHG